MKRLLLFLTILFFYEGLHAQHPGLIGRYYHYFGDSLTGSEAVSALTYDSLAKEFFFCSSGLLMPTGTFYTTFYKIDQVGNVLEEVVDSMNQGNVTFASVAESADGYLYWGGFSFVYGDTTSINWKIRKTDKDLNVIWDRLYHSPYSINLNYSIKVLNNNRLLLACYDFTNSNSLGLPIKRSTPLLRFIDSSGNILTETRPLEIDYTTVVGLEGTNDGGFMLNGSSNPIGYVMKTDGSGNHLWHRFYGTDAPDAWLTGMCRQQGMADNFYHTGQIIIDGNNDGIGWALKTDSAGNILWEKRLSKNGTSDGFFSAASAKEQEVVFAGSAYFPNGSFARGWMVKMDKNGNELWNKLYTTPHLQSDHDYLYKVIPMPDGGYTAAGSTYGQDANGNWTQQAWLLRVDSNGCYDSACSEYTAVKNVTAPKEAINLFPNPSPGPLHLIKTTPFPAGTTVTLSDMSGKEVLRTLESPASKTQQVYQLRGSLPPGMYIIDIRMGTQVVQKKWVLLP